MGSLNPCLLVCRVQVANSVDLAWAKTWVSHGGILPFSTPGMTFISGGSCQSDCADIVFIPDTKWIQESTSAFLQCAFESINNIETIWHLVRMFIHQRLNSQWTKPAHNYPPPTYVWRFPSRSMYYSLIRLHKIGYIIFIMSFLSPFIFTRMDHYMVT